MKKRHLQTLFVVVLLLIMSSMQLVSANIVDPGIQVAEVVFMLVFVAILVVIGVSALWWWINHGKKASTSKKTTTPQELQ